MIKHFARLRLLALLGGLLLASACSAAPDAAAPYTDGDQYVTLPAPHERYSPAGKVEVVEVFSYGCIHCAHFAPTADQLRKSLPKGVVFKLMPAPFNEQWMPFARAYYAADKLGVVERTPDGRVEVRNPAIIRVGVQLAGLGYGIDDLMTVLRVLMQHSRSVADGFVQMFLDVQWKDYVEAGMPPERLPELQALIEQLQPLASQAVVAAFQQAMTDATTQAFEREATMLQ